MRRNEKRNRSIEEKRQYLASKGYETIPVLVKDYPDAPMEDRKLLAKVFLYDYAHRDIRDLKYGKGWRERAKYDENGHLILESVMLQMDAEKLQETTELLAEICQDEYGQM